MKKKYLTFIFKALFVLLIIAFFVQAFLLYFKDNSDVLSKDQIVLLELNGVILQSEPIIDKMKKYAGKPNVKGFILKINSPGGGVAPSQEIYEYIRNLRKPVYAAISSLGASGGYYVAAACDKIYAMPGSITGSIGVIMKFTNLKELYNKIGIKSISITSGKFKDIGSSSRDMTNEEKTLLKSSIMDVYNQFINDIVISRKTDKKILKKYADGRILTGNQAKKIGLIDKLGTYNDAFKDMKRRYHIKNAELLIPKAKINSLEKLFGKIQFFENKLNLNSGFYYLLEM